MVYESRLEPARLLYADFDFSVNRIVAQPFLLNAEVNGQARRHIPDLLLITDTGAVAVDVKPRHRLADPRFRRRLLGPDWPYLVNRFRLSNPASSPTSTAAKTSLHPRRAPHRPMEPAHPGHAVTGHTVLVTAIFDWLVDPKPPAIGPDVLPEYAFRYRGLTACSTQSKTNSYG